MKKSILAVLLISTQLCYSQRFVTQETLDKVKVISDKYENSNFYHTSSKTEISFIRPKNESLLKVTQTVTKNTMALKDGKSLGIYEFTSDNSSMTLRYSKNTKGKSDYSYISKRKYSSNDFFHHDIYISSFSKHFSKPGNEMEYSYNVNYSDSKYFTSVYFNEGNPVKKKQIIVEVPTWLDLKIIEYNFDGSKIEKSSTTDPKTSTKTITYTLKDSDPFVNEANCPSNQKIYPHLIFIVNSFTKKNDETITAFKNTEDLYSWYRSLVKMVTLDKSVLEPKVKELTDGKDSDKEKIESIFYWVQDNIRYLAFENGIMGFKPENADAVFTNKYGDCKGMANLVKNMLAIAGFDARLTWIGTKTLPYDYSIPSLIVDNHMICTLIWNDKKYFLDPTEKMINFGDYAYRIQGKQVLIEDGDKFIIETVPEESKILNTVSTTNQITIKEDQLFINGKKEVKGEEKRSLLRYIDNTKTNDVEDLYERYITARNKNFHVLKLTHTPQDDREKDAVINYEIRYDNAITEIDGETYIAPLFSAELKRLHFDKDRKTPFQFYYPSINKETTTITIPTGKKISYLPETVNVETPYYSLNLSYKQTGNKVIMTKVIKLTDKIIPLDHLQVMNKNLKKLKSFYNDQIVLK